MATNLQILVNEVNANSDYDSQPSYYELLDLELDYLIWSAGSDAVKDGEAEPTQGELNDASTEISETEETQVAHCLMLDYDANELKEVIGMGGNYKYVFCFRFDGDTATEPRIEAWDNSSHNSYANHVLGVGNPDNSMVKAKCTTTALPGANWAKTGGSHIELAGSESDHVVKLNDGNGAIVLASGETHRELYANLAIVIPIDYGTPKIETFVWTCRFSWL